MDVLGAILNVAHLTRRTVEVVQGVREASSDRERLIVAIYSASGLIATFEVLSDSCENEAWEATVKEVLGPNGALTQYQALLAQVLRELIGDAEHGSKMTEKMLGGWKAIRWSYDKQRLASVLREIEDIKSSLNSVVSR